VPSKFATREQAQARKDAAVRFSENVLRDPDKASDIESEDLDDWVERKGITLIDNMGKRSLKMADANQSRQDLLDQIADLQDENDGLCAQLDAIQDVLSGVDDDDGDVDDVDDSD